jgi:hypothetical protein
VRSPLPEIRIGLFSYDLWHTLFEMDPLSLTASITALLGTTAQIIQYLNDVKDASKEKRSLASEAASLLGFLTDLKYRAEEAEQTRDPWYTGIRVLRGENGPLEQFRNSLEELTTKLTTSALDLAGPPSLPYQNSAVTLQSTLPLRTSIVS